MTTESERHLAVLLNVAGYYPVVLGVDRDEAWAKFVHNGTSETVIALYDIDSTDETVAQQLCLAAMNRGIQPRRFRTS